MVVWVTVVAMFARTVFVHSVLNHQWEGRFERMTKHGFPKKHRIVRNAMREDVFQFAIPALLVLTAGLIVSAWDGYDGLTAAVWNLVGQPRSVYLLSVPNIVGSALFVVGMTIAIIAAGTLGRFYSSTLVTRQDHQLI